MGEVGVDLDERRRSRCSSPIANPARYAPPSPSSPGRRSTSICPSSAADLLGELGGAVGAVVVDDEDVGVGNGGAGPPEELVDVLGLVVRRRDDERAHARKLSCYLLLRR